MTAAMKERIFAAAEQTGLSINTWILGVISDRLDSLDAEVRRPAEIDALEGQQGVVWEKIIKSLASSHGLGDSDALSTKSRMDLEDEAGEALDSWQTELPREPRSELERHLKEFSDLGTEIDRLRNSETHPDTQYDPDDDEDDDFLLSDYDEHGET
jgi:hypothetical protein